MRIIGTRPFACASGLLPEGALTVHPKFSKYQNSIVNFSRGSIPGSLAYSSMTSQSLRKTALHDQHVKAGGKMVSFAGHSMPVQYADLSITESHRWTRENASLFDVGHMVQHRVSGPDATRLLSQVTPTSLNSLKLHHSTLSCILLPSGGILDDTVITRLGDDSYFFVTNAACRDKDIKFIKSTIHENKFTDLLWEILDDQGLVALQGPLSAEILSEAIAKPTGWDLKTIYFGQCAEIHIDLGNGLTSEPVLISRGGYTGEDGFEISIPPSQTVEVAQRLLEIGTSERLKWAGLGARDSLRLEAGMCLYGHDLKEDINPVEAGLSWIIGKDRKETRDFNGAETILSQLSTKKSGGTGVAKKRIGLLVEGAPAREGAMIIGDDGEEIGAVTSGCPSPSLGKNIAMGYVKPGWHKAGTEVGVLVRGKRRQGLVTKMPFLPSRYWKQASEALSPA